MASRKGGGQAATPAASRSREKLYPIFPKEDTKQPAAIIAMCVLEVNSAPGESSAGACTSSNVASIRCIRHLPSASAEPGLLRGRRSSSAQTGNATDLAAQQPQQQQAGVLQGSSASEPAVGAGAGADVAVSQGASGAALGPAAAAQSAPPALGAPAGGLVTPRRTWAVAAPPPMQVSGPFLSSPSCCTVILLALGRT